MSEGESQGRIYNVPALYSKVSSLTCDVSIIDWTNRCLHNGFPGDMGGIAT